MLFKEISPILSRRKCNKIFLNYCSVSLIQQYSKGISFSIPVDFLSRMIGWSVVVVASSFYLTLHLLGHGIDLPVSDFIWYYASCRESVNKWILLRSTNGTVAWHDRFFWINRWQFASNCFFCQQRLLDLVRLGPIQSIADLFRVHTHGSKILHLSGPYKLFWSTAIIFL